MLNRRSVLQLSVLSLFGLAGCPQQELFPPTPSSEQRLPDPPSDSIRLETITDQPELPLAYRFSPDGMQYIADRPGKIYALDNDLTTALDISDRIRTGSERGLLGLALHPDFADNNLLYVRYSAPTHTDFPGNYSHTFRLSEYTANADGSIDRESERVLLEIPEPQGNHNSGPIEFGPDGYLYIGVGDGGGSNDRGQGHVEDWYGAVRGGNGQDITENLLGSLLRIDVDTQDGALAYGIPGDNPLVGTDGLDEIFAWGLRNPWGHSFDEDTLYLADVGQNQYEEVSIIENGGNYGWNVKEATHCFNATDCPGETPDGQPLIDPIIEYAQDDPGPVTGIAVVGGHIYRGTNFPALKGKYMFGDLVSDGRLFIATPQDQRLWDTTAIDVTETSQPDLQRLFAIEMGPDNELYVLTNSGIHRLVTAD